MLKRLPLILVSGSVGSIAITIGSIGPHLLLWQGLLSVGVIVDLKAKSCWCNSPVAVDKSNAEDWLGEEIQHTIEDGFIIGCDDVAALAESPGDGIEEPDDEG